MTTTMVHVRLNKDIKRRGERALEAMGLTVSDAVRLLMVRVAADQAFPFRLEVPNAVTRKAMRDAVRGKTKRSGSAKEMFDALGTMSPARL
jgi:DNA-damage-inducible protein J